MTVSHPTTGPFRVRTLVHGCVFLLLATGFVQVWLLDGTAAPYRIVGGSMAETLIGVHRDVACDDCGFHFVCGTDVRPVPVQAVCPNCGCAANNLQSQPDVNADRVFVDRSVFSIRSPRRWEVVAFRHSQQADNILLKRVVGLPGELVEIRNGDVYVDGHIQRKDLTQQRALAVMVHDATFEPTRKPTPPSRWQAEPPENRWNSSGGRFWHTTGQEDEPIDWLVYHHWQRLVEPGDVRASPITDISGYNPWQTRREENVHPVTDLILSFRLGPVSGRGAFYIRASDGYTDFETRLQFDANPRRYQIFRDGEPLADAEGDISATDRQRLIEVSLVDQQFLLAIDGVTLVTWPYDRPESSPPPSPSPLAIGTRGLVVTVSDLRVYRDVYYTSPVGGGRGQHDGRSSRLESDEYYVLGDNSPASEDSRNWSGHWAVDAKLLIGKPLLAIPTDCRSLGGRWYFQVPNPMEIRYIR